MRRLIAWIRDPVIAFDRDVRIVAVNRATERLFDQPAGELIGHDTTVLRPVDHGLRERRNRQVREHGFVEGVAEFSTPMGRFSRSTCAPVASA